MDENRVTYFGETDARNKRVRFGIKAKDRTKHVYVIGKTGMGKSTMLENMAVQDIQNGEGMCIIDPHGKTADLLLEYVPKERINDVIYIAPFDVENPISFNVLESVDADKKHLVVSGLMSTFKKIWVDAWSARMEYILTNTLLALLDYPGSTLLGVNRMLSDKDYRKEVVNNIIDPSVKMFWTKEFAGYTERMAAEAVPAIQNKIGQFTANPLIRNMIGQPESSFDFRQAMDTKKIVIINLSKGRIGDENMKLLGGMLVTKIYLSAMSRADLTDRMMKVMPNFYLYVDEFQNFANASFADILSEARKYKLNLTIAHQYIEQMDEQVGAAVFGNVGTMICFRVGATDAEALEKEFIPSFTIEDLVNLGFTQIYLKLMIDGLTSPPFSAVTLPPIATPEISYMKEIIQASRSQFSKPRAEVEANIATFHESTSKKPATPPAGAPISAASGIKPVSSSSASAPNSSTAPITPKPVTPITPVQKPAASAPSAAPTSKPASSASAPSIAKVTPSTSASHVSHASASHTPHSPHTPHTSHSTHAKTAHTPYSTSKSATPVSATGNNPSTTSANIEPEVKPKPKVFPRIAPEDSPYSSVPTTAEMKKMEAQAPVTTLPASMKTPEAEKTSVQPSIQAHISTPDKSALNAKPVSLDALHQPKQKTDPKAQSVKNVNDLRSALAAAMNKKSETSSVPTVAAVSVEKMEENVQKVITPNFVSTESSSPTMQKIKEATQNPEELGKPKMSENYSPKDPREVPEDVLKNVLKID